MPIHSTMKYDDACMKQWKDAHEFIKNNQEYISEEDKTKLKELGFTFDELKIINAKNRQFIDAEREKDANEKLTLKICY